MRLAILCFLLPFLGMHAKTSFAQKTISLDVKEVSVFFLLENIESRTDFRFVYKVDDVDLTRILDLKVKREKIPKVLNKIFKGTDVDYRILGNQVFLNKRKHFTFQVSSVLNERRLQQIEITGTVTDENGVPLPGVNIVVDGTSRGTNTDFDGNYAIQAEEGQNLIFSFVGFEEYSVEVGSAANIDVQMEESSNALEEVVVTALGIERESRSLGYSATNVSSDALSESGETNLAKGLVGKVAGLDVSSPLTGPGGSAKIRLRGQSSFSGDNSPLIVVNGVPLNNQLDGASNDAGPSGGPMADEGDGMQSLSPDDIKSISVLKGAAAAALYGHRAKDGAILITTKDGAGTKGIGVDVSTSVTFNQPLDLTDFQYEYGQGENGLRPTSESEARSSGTWAFGERFDGQPTVSVDGLEHPYSPQRHRIRDFYRTGVDLTESVSVKGGNDKGSFRLSFTNTDAGAIVPNSKYQKKIFSLGLQHSLTDRLSMQLNVNYSKEYNKNPPVVGQQTLNINQTIYTLANSIDPRWLGDHFEDEEGDEWGISRFTPRANPYWITNKYFYNVHKDRLIGNFSLKYEFTDWLYLQGRIGQDYFSHPVDLNIPTGTAYLAPVSDGFNGYYYNTTTTFREVNLDFLLGFNKEVGDFGFDVVLGGNKMTQIDQEQGDQVDNFYIRDLYAVGNGQVLNPVSTYSERRVNSLYGSAEVSYKNFLFLTGTARNDWYSTLNPDSNSFLYPSVSLSFIATELWDNGAEWLDFLKFRGSFAEVGGDTDPYADRAYYDISSNLLNGVPLGDFSSDISPNPNLRPIDVKEFEFGMESALFDNKLLLNLSYYNKKSTQEIVDVDLSSASGFRKTLINLGELQNQGIEFLLNWKPVMSDRFTWETSINGSYNESEVISLAEGQSRFDVGSGEYFGTISHEVGQPLGSLRGFDYKRDESGNVITSNGRFLQGDMVTFGSAIPKWIGSWRNTFSWGNFNISTQIDMKFGHKLISNSNMDFYRHGLHKATLEGRESGVVFDGVNADGSPNETAVPVEDFFTGYRDTSVATPFVYDASFIRWRNLSVQYDFTHLFDNDDSFIKGLRASVTVNNLLLLNKHVDNLDPESQFSVSDNMQGLEVHSLPSIRSYGFNINVSF